MFPSCIVGQFFPALKKKMMIFTSWPPVKKESSQQNQRQKVEIKFLEKDLDYLREIKEKLFDREILAACLASGAAFVSPIDVL